jgi:anti-sigma regulatory factor (Ser/Thr protein kinase)
VGAKWRSNTHAVLGARLCVAELAANVFEHAAPRPSDEIIVTLRSRDDGFEIEFLDSCAPFDPTRRRVTAQPTSIESASPNGRGLLLVRAYASDLSYRHDGTYNRVTMTIAAAVV